jgi:uncharacterized protein YdcH (DUF465 family)
MASARQIAANRKNAQRSTGPISQAGKTRAAKNALQHGLASTDSLFRPEIEDFARLLSKETNQDDPTFASVDAAHAQLSLLQVRKVKAAIFDRFFESDQTLDDSIRLNEELRKIERYEKRAFSRRKRAMRHL